MRMARAVVMSAALVALAGAAMAQTLDQPPVAPTLTKVEVLGNYAGRQLKLTVDGRVEWDGYGHLNPPGMSWFITVKPGEAPALVELQMEQCEAPFRAEMPRDGGAYALIIQDCDARLVK